MSSAVKDTFPPEKMKSNPPTMANSSRSSSFRGSATATSPASGIVRTPTIRGISGLSRSGRGSIKRPVPNTSFIQTNMDVSDDISEEDARANNASIMDELKSRLRKAETASEEYQRQLKMLQSRLSETLMEQGALEDRLQEGIRQIEMLESDRVQAAREKREMEAQFDAERKAVMKDKQEQKLAEDELQLVNQRLKDALALRETRYTLDEEKGPQRSRKS